MLEENTGDPKHQPSSQEPKKSAGAKPKKKKYGGGRGIETMYRSVYRLHVNLSAIADNKANIMISINALMMSIVFSGIISMDVADAVWATIPAIMLVFNLISITFAVFSARPRLNTHNVDYAAVLRGQQGILFFGNYVHLDMQAFTDAMEVLIDDNQKIYRNLSMDLHSLGLVLARKYAMLRYSYNVFLIGLVFSVVTFLFIFYHNFTTVFWM